MEWFILILGVLLIGIAAIGFIRIHKINVQVDEENNILEKKKILLQEQCNGLSKTIENVENQLNKIQNSRDELMQGLDKHKELCDKAFENYCNLLENKYNEKEEEWNMDTDALQTAYSNLQLKLMKETDEVRAVLDKIRATRTAAIEANLREKEIENNIAFYCLEISDTDKTDIAKLEALKPTLNKPRVLSMLIWQTWFMKPLKSLSANVIGANDKMGIYKITNIKTKECYIGQAVSIKDRWVEHVKCGLGIDTPAANKLYKAMQEYGLWNFSFEVLEECPREQLNEKEKYYIDLYQSYSYGYNSNTGIKK